MALADTPRPAFAGFEEVAAGRRHQPAARDGEAVDVIELRTRVRLVEMSVGLQRAVERRHGDGRLAAAEEVVESTRESADHAFPQ